MIISINRSSNAAAFPKAGELIEITGAHDLEYQDRAVLSLLYQHAYNSGRLGDTGAEWELPLSALRSSRHESNDRLRDSLRRLMRMVVTVPFPSGQDDKPRAIQTYLFDFFAFSTDKTSSNTMLRFGLPRHLQPLLARSPHWGRLEAAVIRAMTSKYAIALYELLQLRADMKRRVETFTLERFREMLGVSPGTYNRGDNFKAKVIDPALLEVNGLSSMTVKIELHRRHARAPIHSVTMEWCKKHGDGNLAAQQERTRGKAGRKARLRLADPMKDWPMKDWIDGRARTGRYSNASDYGCDQQGTSQRASHHAGLQALITEGMESGISTRSIDEVLNDAREKSEKIS